MLSIRYIYCYWLFLIFILYTIGLYPSHTPPLISFMFATIFTTVYITYFRLPYDRYSAPLFELGMVLVAYYIWERRKGTWENYNLLPETILFTIYLLYIQSSGYSFYRVYFVENAQFQKKYNKGVIDYIKYRWATLLK